eukprot:GHVL01023635.1.p1 GENE.GHVL01023635.1~~GHVL01023635.1.p1  ORF type:complete len:728 (+),score=131.14 GHVL01023635.1:48-2186(+)
MSKASDLKFTVIRKQRFWSGLTAAALLTWLIFSRYAPIYQLTDHNYIALILHYIYLVLTCIILISCISYKSYMKYGINSTTLLFSLSILFIPPIYIYSNNPPLWENYAFGGYTLVVLLHYLKIKTIFIENTYYLTISILIAISFPIYTIVSCLYSIQSNISLFIAILLALFECFFCFYYAICHTRIPEKFKHSIDIKIIITLFSALNTLHVCQINTLFSKYLRVTPMQIISLFPLGIVAGGLDIQLRLHDGALAFAASMGVLCDLVPAKVAELLLKQQIFKQEKQYSFSNISYKIEEISTQIEKQEKNSTTWHSNNKFHDSLASVSPPIQLCELQDMIERCKDEAQIKLTCASRSVSNMPPEYHPCITVLFTDITGFTRMCGMVTPRTVMKLLDELYYTYDELALGLQVYKVETIGDCYMAAAGLFGYDKYHADRMVIFGRALQKVCRSFRLLKDEPLNIRIGIHSGPVYAGIIGRIRKRFCLFGDTVNTASRMESTCPSGEMQISSNTKSLLTTKFLASSEYTYKFSDTKKDQNNSLRSITHSRFWRFKPCTKSVCDWKSYNINNNKKNAKGLKLPESDRMLNAWKKSHVNAKGKGKLIVFRFRRGSAHMSSPCSNYENYEDNKMKDENNNNMDYSPKSPKQCVVLSDSLDNSNEGYTDSSISRRVSSEDILKSKVSCICEGVSSCTCEGVSSNNEDGIHSCTDENYLFEN